MNKKLIEQIERIKKNMNLIKEDRKHDFGCVMIFFDFPEMSKLHGEIDENDVYFDENDDSFGLEKEPHTTLLFGLHDEVSTEDIKKIINKFKFGECEIFNPSLFNNEQYDVLKFDVKGDNLHECNSSLKEFPHTSSYPDYHPHLTIGYIKPGLGEKYTKKFKGLKHKLTPQHVIYSKPNGDKDKIDLVV